MISPEAGRAAFNIGFFVLLVSGILLLAVERGSAEFFVTLFTFLIALVFTVGVGILVRISTRGQ